MLTVRKMSEPKAEIPTSCLQQNFFSSHDEHTSYSFVPRKEQSKVNVTISFNDAYLRVLKLARENRRRLVPVFFSQVTLRNF